MKAYLISQYIDDELSLDEKCEFVETVHASRDYTQETLELLGQEKMLRADVVTVVPPVAWEASKRWNWSWLTRAGLMATGLAAVLWLFLVFQPALRSPSESTKSKLVPYRFVIFQPDATQAQIVGSFTGWQSVAMHKTGGYWQITLAVPTGEHRFSYILDGRQQVTDPTLPVREPDDFGGENSILEVHPA